MARFFKPMLSAVALATAALTSTGALAAYAYNAQISVTAPKGSAAEAAAKDKTLPTGVKTTSCADKITSVTPPLLNQDQLTLTVKYDAGKAQGEIGDVYVVLQNLSEASGAATSPRYIILQRKPDFANGLTVGFPNPLLDDMGLSIVTAQNTAALIALDNATAGADIATWDVYPYMSASANSGQGAQTEVLFGGNLDVTGLDQGLWTASVIIAKPGGLLNATADFGALPQPANSFSFVRPETWAASDTVAFIVGSPTTNDLDHDGAVDDIPVNFDIGGDGTTTADEVAETLCR